MKNNKQAPKVVLLVKAINAVSKIKRFWNVWRTTEQWLSIIMQMYPELRNIGYTKLDINRTIMYDPV